MRVERDRDVVRGLETGGGREGAMLLDRPYRQQRNRKAGRQAGRKNKKQENASKDQGEESERAQYGDEARGRQETRKGKTTTKENNITKKNGRGKGEEGKSSLELGGDGKFALAHVEREGA